VDLARLRYGDWVMGLGGLAVLVVMFLDWYEPARPENAPAELIFFSSGGEHNAWEAFAVNDVILAVAALMALTAFVLTAVHPTAAVPLAISSLAALVSLVALILVSLRLIWPPDLFEGPAPFDTVRVLGAWLGLVATTVLTGGCLASIRDERLPQPEHPVEPRLVQP
jgi:hypothetical protein